MFEYGCYGNSLRGPAAGRSLVFDRTKPELYMRIERQLLIGFSECNAALFTIRTYFRDVAELL